jgi:hypothetical protein
MRRAKSEHEEAVRVSRNGLRQTVSGGRREALVLVALTVLAAGVRIYGLGAQSYWYDEALTVDLLREPFDSMLDGVLSSEAEPPLYFSLAWGWAHLFGDGEAALRSLSAVFGTLTVPVAYAAAKLAAGRRVAIAVALLAALSPMLVWYSQEARAYALLTFLCAVSLLFFQRSLEQPSAVQLAAWASASALAVVTHYFALFLVLPEAAVLLGRSPDRRRAWLALAGLGAALVLIAPLLLRQRSHGGGDWIQGSPLVSRLAGTAFSFAIGPSGAGVFAIHHRLTALLAGLIAAAALLAAVRRSAGATRRRLLVLLGLGVAVVCLPVAGHLVGNDYLLDRNVLPAWIPLAIVATAGLGAANLRSAGWLAIGAICLVYAFVDFEVPRHQELQRDDWRALAAELPPPSRGRVIEVSPYWQAAALRLYKPGMQPLRDPRAVTEVATITYDGTVPFNAPVAVRPPARPFVEQARRTVQRMTLTVYRAPGPRVVTTAAFVGTGPNRSGLFIERR